MKPKRFSNQSKEQILKHLGGLLSGEVAYNLSVDPLGIRFLLTESTCGRKELSDKRKMLKEEGKGLSKGQRKKTGTRKRTGPKIRSVKKGRTVSLKGRTY